MHINKKKELDRRLGTPLLLLLKIPVILLGRFLKRDHDIEPKGDILFIKFQGGGSLVLAYPSLLAIRKKYPMHKITLFTTNSVAPFAESLKVFDQIICLDDRNVFTMFVSSLNSYFRTILGHDTVIDLEVYSMLSTVFSTITMARNRIGFYLENVFWRKNLQTHLVYFNRFGCSQDFYEDIARLFSTEPVAFDDASESFRMALGVHKNEEGDFITIGHACSEMGSERMLSASQWVEVFKSRGCKEGQVVFVGSQDDRESASRIIEELIPHFRQLSFSNKCGELSLSESVSLIARSREFLGVDSALLHYARLLARPNISFWGPTDPSTRLKQLDQVPSEIYYNKIKCSPCIHVTEMPPCSGKAGCIEAIFSPKVECPSLRVSSSIVSHNESRGHSA